MVENALHLQEVQQDFLISGLAFITTAIHVVLMFPLFSYTIAQQRYFRSPILILAFLSGFTTHGLWLIYIWSFGNLFMITTLCLLMISQLIFLIQTLLIRRSNHSYSAKIR